MKNHHPVPIYGEGPARSFVVCILIASTLLAVHFLAERNRFTGRAGNGLADFPVEIGGWKNPKDFPLGRNVVDTLKVDEYVNRDYYNGGKDAISLYIGYYRSHKNFVEIHTPENCQANSGWSVLSKEKKSVRLGGSGEKEFLRYMEAVYAKNGKRYLMIYFYKVGGEATTSFFRYRYLVVRNSLLENRSDAMFVRVMFRVEERDPSRTIGLAERFTGEVAKILFRSEA